MGGLNVREAVAMTRCFGVWNVGDDGGSLVCAKGTVVVDVAIMTGVVVAKVAVITGVVIVEVAVTVGVFIHRSTVSFSGCGGHG